MEFGMGLPLGGPIDPSELKDVAQQLDGAGVNFVSLAGHLLSAEPGRFPDRPEGTYAGVYLDPLTTFSWLAAATSKLQFMTSVLIAPLYPTALLARQAAQLAILSGGRFQLGIGISWNPIEYQALGQDVHRRGRQMEEQITVLKKLWTEPFVTFEGRFHKLEGVGLKQLPPKPVPIWMGTGTGEDVLRRVAKHADGWIPTTPDPAEPIARLKGYLADEKRDAGSFGLVLRLNAANDNPGEWLEAGKKLQAYGATRINIGSAPGMNLRDQVERTIKVRTELAPALG
ncbi:MAG: TIGR03619 family F420-dependent LLM class oxidoreductase [Chloroflexi bacterium]|nr:TIGR03619 family F420-dependent LLM class oxidoreductase [Chloroflexota bacterium]